MINNLTNDMTRLCGEIAALRSSRAESRAEMQEAITQLQESVTQMLTGFGEARSEMAKQTKTELSEFIAQVKESVTELQQKVAKLQEEFRDDLGGAHRAWHGGSPAPRASRPAPTVSKSSFRAEEPAAETASKAKKKKR